MIDAHIIDERGVYLRTEQADPMGPQSAGAIYGELPESQDGYTRMYLNGEWVQVLDADVPKMPEPVDPVPSSCTWRQGQKALLRAGKLDSVNAAIESIQDPFEKQDALIELGSPTYERSSPFLQAMWSQLGGTESELDDLFRMAVTL